MQRCKTYHVALPTILSLMACLDAPPQPSLPQSLEPISQHIPPELRKIPASELCTALDSMPEQKPIHYSLDKFISADAKLPTSHEQLRWLNLLAAHSLLSPAPKEHVKRFAEAAAQRLGFGSEQLSVELGPDGRLYLWNLRIVETPRQIGRFPACAAKDFNPKALLAARPTASPEQVALPTNLAYLKIGDSANQATWSTLQKQTEFKTASIPPVFALENSTLSSDFPKANKLLKLLTYNTALLNYKIFGFIPVRFAPLVEERRSAILEAVFLHDDIVALQELWEPVDGDIFAQEAHKRGFAYFNPSKAHASNGLGLAIRRSIIDPSSAVTHDVYTFNEQIPKEYWAASWSSFGLKTGIKRGFQAVSFSTRNNVSITVINTHFTAYRENWRMRLTQAKQLASFARAQETDIVIVLGDLNGDIHYAANTFTNPLGEESFDWTPNAFSTPLLAAAGGLDDWSTIGFGEDFPTECYSLALEKRDRRCHPTWDHANTVVRQQYEIAREPQGRLDFILGRSNRPISPPKTTLVFSEKAKLKNGIESHLSDHFGVRVELRYETESSPE